MYYLIVNPKSGKQNNLEKLREIKDILLSRGKRCEEHILYRGENDGDVIVARFKEADPPQCVIIVGGDGTISKVINWLLASGISVPIGLIPSGTCNDFGGVLGLGKTVAQQTETILRGETVPVDLGVSQAGGKRRYFFCCWEAGQMSLVSYGAPPQFKKHFRMAAHYFMAIRQALRIRAFPVTLQTESQRFSGRIFVALILNGPQFAGCPYAIREANFSDGKLNLVLFSGKRRTALLSLLKFFAGRSESDPHCRRFAFSHLFLDASPEVDTMSDGDCGDALPQQIDVLPGALRIFAPAEKP